MEYLFHIIALAGIYTILAMSLDLIAGHTGLLSLAHAAFYGLGAYTSALLAVEAGAPFIVGILTGVAAAAFASLLVSVPAARLHEDYFAIATFGFQVIAWSVFNNWVRVTRGPLGIPGIPRTGMLGWTFATPLRFMVLTGAVVVFAYIVIGRMTSSPFGRVLHAIREDENLVRAFGKNPLRFKVTGFAVSAAFAALAGGLFAGYITYIDPTSFTVMESILVISMVIIGGAGSRWGPLVGAVVLVTLPEALRFVGLPGAIAANIRQIVYGTLLVIMMIVRPRGLLGRYGFSRQQ